MRRAIILLTLLPLLAMAADVVMLDLSRAVTWTGSGSNMVASQASQASYWIDPNTNALLCRYDFEGTGWTNDTSGRGWNFQPNGGASNVVIGTNSQGRQESAYSNDSGARSLVTSTSFGNSLGKTYTFAAWVFANPGSWNSGIAHVGGTGWGTMEVFLYAGNLYFNANGYDGDGFYCGFPTQSWTHVVCTYNGSTKTIYTNAVYANSSNYSSTPNSNNKQLYIGIYYDAPYAINGKIDAVMLYTNKLLNASEITNLFNNVGGTNGPIKNNEAR